MIDLLLRLVQRLGLWLGVVLMGAAVFAGGRTVYRNFTYVPVQARILAVTAKCDMSYRESRWNHVQQLVECAEVPAINARNPEINWHVYRSPFVSIVYQTSNNQRIYATVRLADLQRSHAVVGEIVPVLYSAAQPDQVSGPINFQFVRMWSVFFVIGFVLIGFAWLAGRMRRRGAVERQPRLSRTVA